MPSPTPGPDLSAAGVAASALVGTVGPDGACRVKDAPVPLPPPSGKTCDGLRRLLAGCCHPRAERLRAQIDANASPSDRQIAGLRDEVVRLLTVCYGPAEARRQIDELTGRA